MAGAGDYAPFGRPHPAFPSRLALAVLLPVLMTGSVAAADLLITNGTSTKSH
jgi:hypothetical protein